MKFKRIICIAISLLIFSLSLVSCSSGNKSLFTFRGTELSTNMYSYMISSQKAYLKQLFDYYNSMSYAYYKTYYFGTNDFDAYLRSTQKDEDGNEKTVAELTNDMVINSAKSMVIIDHFCKQYGLKITDESTVADINSALEDDILNAGSKEYLNILLSQYGADYDIAEQYLYNSVSAEVLYSYLYGENGTQRLSDAAVKEEFEKSFNKMDLLYYEYYTSDSETGDSAVKEVASVTEDDINSYLYASNVKIQFILIYTIDRNTQNALPEEKLAEKETLANTLFAQLNDGDTTLEKAKADHENDVYLSSGVFAKGEVQESIRAVEEAAFALEIGKYACVKTDIGYYIIRREAITGDDITDSMRSAAKEALNKAAIKSFAETALDKFNAGILAFSDYTGDGEKPDAYGRYIPSVIFAEGEVEAALYEKVSQMELNEYAVIDLDNACCLVRKAALGDDDYKERYDTVYDELAQAAFQEFINGFYSEVIVDEEELSKYDFLTANPLELVPLDESNAD